MFGVGSLLDCLVVLFCCAFVIAVCVLCLLCMLWLHGCGVIWFWCYLLVALLSGLDLFAAAFEFAW